MSKEYAEDRPVPRPPQLHRPVAIGGSNWTETDEPHHSNHTPPTPMAWGRLDSIEVSGAHLIEDQPIRE
ncbi:MAG: hypothetical protein ABFR53_08670, partial [Actinomycetota bacterium]